MTQFHKSSIDSFYPTVEDFAKGQLGRLQNYAPDVGKWTSAYREAVGVSRGLIDTVDMTQGALGVAFENVPLIENTLAKNLKKVASDNVTTAMTTGDHPVIDFIAGAVPYVGLSLATGGLSMGATELVAEQASQKAAFNAVANTVEPATFSTKALAAEVGVNSAIAAQSSLVLDDKGNVKVDPKTLIEGLLLAGGVPALGLGARALYHAKVRGRVLKTKPKAEPKVEPEEIKAYSKPEDIPDTEALLSKDGEDIVETSDIKLPDTENVNRSLDVHLSDLNDKTHLHIAALAVKDLDEHGVHLDGQKFDIDDVMLLPQIEDTIDHMNKSKDARGSQKVSLTKTIKEASKADKDKWEHVTHRAEAIPYRSKGAITTGVPEEFYQFRPETFSPKIIDNLKRAPDKDMVAKSLLALHNLSATHNFDANLSMLRALRKNIHLHKNGILDLLKNWNKMDDVKINNFISEIHAKYAEYFTDPISSGYLKMTAHKRLFGDLVGCLLRNM